MKQRTRRCLGIGAAVLVVIQFLGPARTNSPVTESHTLRSRVQIPPRVGDILNRACMDCHSQETRWPWYSRVAPVRWWLVGHVNGGRKELNLSEWTQYSSGYAAATLGSMAEAARRDLMPPESYQILHPGAKLSAEEKKVFCDWAQAEKRRLQDGYLNRGKTAQ